MTRKRLFVFGLLALLILAFVACSGPAEPVEEAETEEEAPEAVEEEMPSADVSGEITIGSWRVDDVAACGAVAVALRPRAGFGRSHLVCLQPCISLPINPHFTPFWAVLMMRGRRFWAWRRRRAITASTSSTTPE